jgi:hypothetical protein
MRLWDGLGSGALLAWLALALLFRVVRPRLQDAPAASYRRLLAALLLASLSAFVPCLRSWLPSFLRVGAPLQLDVQVLATASGSAPLGLRRGLYLSPFDILGFIWLGTTTVGLTRLVVARVRLALQLNRARSAPVPLQQLCSRLALRLGARVPRLLLCTEARAPFSAGVLRPTIVLPLPLLDELQRDKLELVLRHELIHIRRRDPLSHALAKVSATSFTFHPTLKKLMRELLTAREAAVDAELAAEDPRAYASLLIELAARSRFGQIPAHVSMDDTALARRIAMLTNPAVRLKSPSLAAALAAAGAICAVGLLSPRVFAESNVLDALPLEGPLQRSLKDHDPLAAYQGDIDACYELARAEDDELVIDTLARFDVDPTSFRVSSASVPTPSSPIFQKCLEEKALSGWSFPPPPDMPPPPKGAQLLVAVKIQRPP